MPQNLGRAEGAAMTHMEAFGPTLHQAFQFAGNLLRVILEGRTDRPPLEGDAADQDPGCDQVADQSVLG